MAHNWILCDECQGLEAHNTNKDTTEESVSNFFQFKYLYVYKCKINNFIDFKSYLCKLVKKFTCKDLSKIFV